MTDMDALLNDIPGLETFLDAWCDPSPNPQGPLARWVCPNCGSGKRTGGTPALSVTPDHRRWKCFSCEHGGDALDLAKETGKGSTFQEQLDAVCSVAGISPSAYRQEQGTERPTRQCQNASQEAVKRNLSDAENKAAQEAAEVIERAQEAFWGPGGAHARAYVLDRGFSEDECRLFGFGMHEGRLLIPWPTRDYWTARSIDGGGPKYRVPRGTSKPPWEHGAKPGEVVWLVEGQLDALSLKALGFRATAIAGTGNRANIERLAQSGVAVIVATDSDGPGTNAGDEAERDLRALGVPCTRFTWEGFKDANEVFQSDREHLRWLCASEEQDIHARLLSEKHVEKAVNLICDLVDPTSYADPFPTGIGCVDTALEGGLPAGCLTVIGAVSSAGKTTFCVQVADHMAELGHPVLFVSCEQSARELQAKSVVRIAQERYKAKVSIRQVMTPKGRAELGDAARESFEDAVNEYGKTIAPNLYIMQPDGKPTPSMVRDAVEAVRTEAGEYPALFVDYIQLFGSSTDQRADTRRCVDEAVMEFRQIARKTGAPVVVISSLSREHYNGALSMESFKESGGLEYGADLLLGLEPDGVGAKDGDKAKTREFLGKWKEQPTRDLRVTVLKNRNGACLYGDNAPVIRFNTAKCCFYDAFECGYTPKRTIGIK